MTTDILMTADEFNVYDFSLNSEGDITNGDFFDSSMLYSIYGERRALASEVPASHRRRGWIGNEHSDYENGSKIWLFEQEKLTRTNLNSLQSEGINALQWMITDGFAIGNLTATAVVQGVSTAIATVEGVGIVGLLIGIQRPSSKVEERFFELWNNTGISSNGT